MSDREKLEKELEKLKNPQKALLLGRFFKTGKGEYGEGDKFLGIVVPKLREVAKKYPDLSLNDLQILLNSKIHEYRMISLFILIAEYKKADEKKTQEIVNFYLKNAKNINNWDLVDLSAPNIIGMHLLDKDRKILYKLAKSENIWEKRIAILSTFQLIKHNQLEDSLIIAEILLLDKHDLIHKAVGWMLREIGKRDLKVEEKFLDKYSKTMPRTTLRYAIEKFSEEKRQMYLKK